MQIPPKRPNYFAGQLITARDLQAEQDYHRHKRLLLNRTLHGSGVVCGLLVRPTEGCGPARVLVEPGLALDASGREIVIPEPQELDLGESVMTERVFIALEYEEIETDWAPVLGEPDAEDSRRPTRVEEGYRLSVRREPIDRTCESDTLILAAVDPGSGPVSEERIDNATHRRVVRSSQQHLEAIALEGRFASLE